MNIILDRKMINENQVERFLILYRQEDYKYNTKYNLIRKSEKLRIIIL